MCDSGSESGPLASADAAVTTAPESLTEQPVAPTGESAAATGTLPTTEPKTEADTPKEKKVISSKIKSSIVLIFLMPRYWYLFKYFGLKSVGRYVPEIRQHQIVK
jgi:hypothetical protein